MASFTPLEDPSKSLEDIKSANTEGQKRVGIIVDKSCRVLISNIPVSRIEEEGPRALRKEFEEFGAIESYQLFTDRSGRFTGKALCTYRSTADAAAALAKMNGLSVDGVTIAVEASRDHGVVLFNDRNEKGFFAKSEKEDGDKWSHDKYELIKEGKPMKEVIGYTFRSEREPEEWEGRGRGRGGRGGRGRGRMPRAEYIESQFEKYIAERDARLNKQNNVESNESKPTEGEATASTEANVPKPVGEEGPIE